MDLGYTNKRCLVTASDGWPRFRHREGHGRGRGALVVINGRSSCGDHGR